MDKEESINLDVEFNQYLQILRPYLEQLLNEEDIKICNAWIHKLSDCGRLEKSLRNKYIFTLCFQLAKGVLSTPFNNYPPNNLTFEVVSSNDSFSDPDTQITYFIKGNDKNYCHNKLSSKTSCRPINSEITMCSSKTEINNEMDDIKTFTRGLLSPSNSITNCLYGPEILNDFNANFENNVYLRVNNLVNKLRDIRKQNTMLNEELQLLKEESKLKRNSDISSQTSMLQIHCATNTDKFNHNESLDQQCSCKANLIELEESFLRLNESKRIEFEELKRKHENEIMNAKTSIKTEIENVYEKQIRELTGEYDSKIKALEESTETKIKELTIHLNKMTMEKATKEKEINNLRSELDEIKAQNYILRNQLTTANGDINLESIKEKAFQLERRLYKTEKSKNKRIRAYQVQLTCLEREKNFLASSMHLQLLKQRSEQVSDLTDQYQKELITGFDKLEEKYKEIVANVQAAAIQRRIRDQMVLDEIIKEVYDNDNELNGLSIIHDSQDRLQSQSVKNNTKNKSCPLSLLRSCRDDLTDKALFNLEDSFVTGFCLDEVKFRELFKRVRVTQNKSGDGQIDDNQ